MNWIQCALVNAGKKEIVLHKATGSAVTARRYRPEDTDQVSPVLAISHLGRSLKLWCHQL